MSNVEYQRIDDMQQKTQVHRTANSELEGVRVRKWGEGGGGRWHLDTYPTEVRDRRDCHRGDSLEKLLAVLRSGEPLLLCDAVKKSNARRLHLVCCHRRLVSWSLLLHPAIHVAVVCGDRYIVESPVAAAITNLVDPRDSLLRSGGR